MRPFVAGAAHCFFRCERLIGRKPRSSFADAAPAYAKISIRWHDSRRWKMRGTCARFTRMDSFIGEPFRQDRAERDEAETRLCAASARALARAG